MSGYPVSAAARNHRSATQDGGNTLRAMLLVAALLVCLDHHFAYCADAREYRRWAIVATPEAQQSGMPDLLTAELSQQESFELVERDQIDLALRELKLSAMFGSSDGKSRLQLGKLLGADAMLLLSADRISTASPRSGRIIRRPGSKPAKKEYVLNIVICESRMGIRLLTMQVPLTADAEEAIVERLLALVIDSRTRLKQGIRHVFAVTPFLARGLKHEHEELQTSFRVVVEQGLLAFPGVAVLEMDEVLAIGRELRLGGNTLRDRLVPLLIEGEYEVTGHDQNGQPVLRLALKVRDGEKVRSRAERQNVALKNATEMLAINVPKAVMRLVDKEATAVLSARQQLEALVARAEQFDQMGAWSTAVPLRQAALLIDPDHLEARAGLVACYRQMAALAIARFYAARIEERDDLMELSQRRYDFWRRSHEHLEQLFFRRLINPVEAAHLLRDHGQDHWQIASFLPNRGEAYYRAVMDSFRRIYPIIRQLDPQLHGGRIEPCISRCSNRPWLSLRYAVSDRRTQSVSPAGQYQEWASHGVDDLMFCSWRLDAASWAEQSPNKVESDETARNQFDWLFWFLTEVADPDLLIDNLGQNLLPQRPFTPLDPRAIRWLSSDPDKVHLLIDFYQRLKAHGGKANDVYGRAGLLALEIVSSDEGHFEMRWIREANELLAYVEEPGKVVVEGRAYDSFKRGLQVLRRHAADRLSSLSGRIAANNGKHHRLPQNAIDGIEPPGRIAFELIEGVEVDWRRLIRCGPNLDIAWSNFEVFAIEAPGRIRKIYGSGNYVENLAWDGRNIWIWDVRKIVIISPRGEVRATVGADEGFPYAPDTPNATPVWFYPLEPGRCLAISVYGANKRVFCAEIAPTDGNQKKYRARIIYSATKKPETRNLRGPLEDLDVIFQPSGLLAYPFRPGTQARTLLVGRGSSDWRERLPLAVDLESLDVSLAPVPVPIRLDRHGRSKFLSHDGQVIRNGGYLGLHVATVGKPRAVEMVVSPEGVRKDVFRDNTISHSPHRRPRVTKDWGLSLRNMGTRGGPEFMLADQGNVYSTGDHWYKFDPVDLTKIERLNEISTPAYRCFTNFAVSNHYGMVAWNRKARSPTQEFALANRRKVFRVLIDQDKEEDPAIPWLFVPQRERRTHVQAVETILGLGGIVGPLRHDDQAGTGVFLGRRWKGRDADLKVLRNLHAFKFLHAVEAPITDAGLTHIGECSDLLELALVATKTTDVGLRNLVRLDSLKSLRLESTAGGSQFTDAGLHQAVKIPQLTHLWLYGSNFTDRGLQALKASKTLTHLELHETSTTTSGIRALKSANRKLAFKRDGMGEFRTALPPEGVKFPAVDLANTASFRPLADETEPVASLRSHGARFVGHADGRVREVLLGGKGLQPDDVAALANLSGLEVLMIETGQVGDKEVTALSALHRLREIYFGGGRITDVGLEDLARMPNLKAVFLSGHEVTLDGIDRLRRNRPDLEIYPPRHDEEAVVELERLGVTCRRDPDGAVNSLAGFKVDRLVDQLEVAARLPKISDLSVTRIPVTDQVLIPLLSKMEMLTRLQLYETQISGSSLSALAAKERIEYLNLKGTPITDEGLKALSEMPKLQNLYLTDVPISDAGLSNLAGRNKLRVLYLNNTQITDASAELLASLPSIRYLGVSETAVSDASVAKLKSMRQLERLLIKDTKISPEGFERLKKALPMTRINYE